MKNKTLSPTRVYHNTELLLENYRNLIWRSEESFENVENTVYYMGGRHLSNIFRLLSMELDEYDNKHSRTAVEERLFSLQESKLIVDVIDKAMLKLKSYPTNGERYFEILYTTYIEKEPLHQDEIQDKLLMSSSTYYRYRKKAIDILGGILWGYMQSLFQEMQSSSSKNKENEADNYNSFESGIN
ncbi:MAG TPA: hypothetical protein DIW17_04290 [Clostridiales bacterium]|nr:DUF1492 domain-containing protein [Clostridia bacterium]HCS73077.1 hypothetical protein [Clostridiales bacterium]